MTWEEAVAAGVLMPTREELDRLEAEGYDKYVTAAAS